MQEEVKCPFCERTLQQWNAHRDPAGGYLCARCGKEIAIDHLHGTMYPVLVIGMSGEVNYAKELVEYIKSNVISEKNYRLDTFQSENEHRYVVKYIYSDLHNYQKQEIAILEFYCYRWETDKEAIAAMCEKIEFQKIILDMNLLGFRAMHMNTYSPDTSHSAEEVRNTYNYVTQFLYWYWEKRLKAEVGVFLGNIQYLGDFPLVRSQAEYKRLVQTDIFGDTMQSVMYRLKEDSDTIRTLLKEINEYGVLSASDSFHAMYFVYPVIYSNNHNEQNTDEDNPGIDSTIFLTGAYSNQNVTIDSITYQYRMLSPLIWICDL